MHSREHRRTSAPPPIVLLFALPDGGRSALLRLIARLPTVHPTESLGAFALPAMYGQRPDGIEAEYDALRLYRAQTRAFAASPELLEEWKGVQRDFLKGLAARLRTENHADTVIDVFPGSCFAAEALARLLPDAPAIVLRPDPLEALAAAYRAAERSAARLKQDEARYRQLYRGPALLAQAIEAFGPRALVLDQNAVEAREDDILDRVRAFLGATVEAGAAPAAPAAPAAATDASPTWPALAADPAFVVIARQYVEHLRPVLGALEQDPADLGAMLEAQHDRCMIEARIARLDLDAFEKLGIPRQAVAEAARAPAAQADEALRRSLAALANRRGEALFGEGEPARAESAFRFSLELDPAYPDALNNLGVMAWQRQDAEQAIDCFSRSYAAEPLNRNTLLNLLETLIASGDSGKARAVLTHHLALAPEDDELLALSLQI